MKKHTTPLKVGERARLYGASQTGAFIAEGGPGTITEVHDENWVQAVPDRCRGMVNATEAFTFHVKQCRRLKKRERRRVWVWINEDGTMGGHCTKLPPDRVGWTPGWREFMEVKNESVA